MTRHYTPRGLTRALLALVATVCLATAGVETGVRLMASALDLSSYMKYDPLLGWTAIPGARRAHKDRRLGFDVRYDINEYGFRGPAYPRAKPAGVRRIVILGDSNGFGWGMSEDEHFASLLDQELPSVQVINLSLSGYGTDQEYLRFVRDGVQFDPDVVVLQVTPNDFDEIQHGFFNGKPKPQFLLTPS
ncbi:MAG: SGNH/GDSL hydrolase family protein, partial [Vicinamibacterales bacterium]